MPRVSAAAAAKVEMSLAEADEFIRVNRKQHANALASQHAMPNTRGGAEASQEIGLLLARLDREHQLLVGSANDARKRETLIDLEKSEQKLNRLKRTSEQLVPGVEETLRTYQGKVAELAVATSGVTEAQSELDAARLKRAQLAEDPNPTGRFKVGPKGLSDEQLEEALQTVEPAEAPGPDVAEFYGSGMLARFTDRHASHALVEHCLRGHNMAAVYRKGEALEAAGSLPYWRASNFSQ